MSNIELTTKIENIKTLQTMIDELTAEMESVKDEVKREMETQGVEEMTVSCFKVRYKAVTSSRFDSTAFKKNYTDLYKEFLRQTVSHRFTISC